MRIPVFFCLLFLLLLVFVGGMGIGIGFLLHWLIPAIGVGIGALIGVVSLGWTIFFFVQLMRALSAVAEDMEISESESGLETIILKPIRPERSTKRKRKK